MIRNLHPWVVKCFTNVLLLNLAPERCTCDAGEGGPELRQHASKAQTGLQVRCLSQKLSIPIHLQHLSSSQLGRGFKQSKPIRRAEQTLVNIFFHLPRSPLLQHSHHTQGQPFPLELKKNTPAVENLNDHPSPGVADMESVTKPLHSTQTMVHVTA